jgi:hypothetical protein
MSLSINPRVTLKFEYEQHLPQKVSGNLEKFRLAMMIAIDFGIKYIAQGTVKIKLDFGGLSNNR